MVSVRELIEMPLEDAEGAWPMGAAAREIAAMQFGDRMMSTPVRTFKDSDGVEWTIEKYLHRICVERVGVDGKSDVRLLLDSEDEVERLIEGLQIAVGMMWGRMSELPSIITAEADDAVR